MFKVTNVGAILQEMTTKCPDFRKDYSKYCEWAIASRDAKSPVLLNNIATFEFPSEMWEWLRDLTGSTSVEFCEEVLGTILSLKFDDVSGVEIFRETFARNGQPFKVHITCINENLSKWNIIMIHRKCVNVLRCAPRVKNSSISKIKYTEQDTQAVDFLYHFAKKKEKEKETKNYINSANNAS